MDFTIAFIQNVLCTEVTANLQRSKPCFHCVRLDSKYWKSVSTFGAHLYIQYHSCDEIVYFSMDITTAFIHNILCPEVTANLQRSKPYFHCVRIDSKYWKPVSTFGALLHFQYHISEEIFYFSMDFTTAFIQNILCTEVTANLHRSKPYFHCVRLDSKYWKSVSTFGVLLHFQYHRSEEIVYFSMDSNPDLAQNVLYTEVTANQQRRKQYFHCARRDSKYWNSVSTFGALLHFQYHSCDEIFYFSMDFTTAFIQNILCTEVTANLQRSKPYFRCVRLDSKYWKSVSTFGALLQFQYHISEEIFYFSMDFYTAFIHNILCTEVRRTCRDQNHTFNV